MNFNPWNVASIDYFLAFNCPECTFHTNDEKNFQDHATKNHPLSAVLFTKGTKVITFSDRKELNHLKFTTMEQKHKPLTPKNTKVIKFNSRNELNQLKQATRDQKCKEVASKYNLPDKIQISMTKSDESKENLRSELNQQCLNDDQKCKELVLKHNLPDRIQVLKKSGHEEKKQEKENVKNNKNKNQCQICFETFPQKWALQFHVTRKHNELLNVRQPLQKVSKERNDKHGISKLIQEKKLKVELKTEIAESTSNTEKKRKHAVNQTSFICSLCNVKVFNKKDLKAHITSVHENRKPYICPIRNCNSTFPDNKKLNRHIKTIHDEKKNLRCHTFDAEFVKKAELKDNQATVHDGGKPFKCDLCGKMFDSRGNLMLHIKTIHECTVNITRL